MKRVASALALFLFVTGCSASFGNPSATLPASTRTILYLVTVPPGATPTTTPFQPVASTATLSPTPVFIVTPLPLDATFDPNALPPGTATPLPLEVTFDPTALPPDMTTPESFYIPPYAPDPALVLNGEGTVTFLLLGSDKRPGQTYFRTDTIVIVVIRPASGQVALISVPRDLYVYIPIPNLNMMDRINTAYEYGEMYHYPGGGFALLKDTLLYNLGLRIDHLAIVDFDGFRRIVDTLGGIDVPVFCSHTDWHLIDPRYDPNNEDNWALYTVSQGVVHMDGDLALWYARSRKKSSDFDRGRRSQEVLRALYTRALQTDSISRIPQLYSDFSSSIITDLTLPDLLQLSPLALHLTNAYIRSYYIGRDLVTGWITPGGTSVLLPNGPAIQSMLQQALAFPPRNTETEALTVEVRNGTVNPGWDSLAVERLNYGGYNTRLAVADRQDYANSLLYDLSANPDLSRITSMLNVLGLPPAAFVPAPMQTDINYRLIVGADYQPCFKPET
ncbi:MAG: LCP family protein, partial [Chloroflexi bacterium]|nr:LCP family protein [Chloroflexota bacterium]